MIHSQTGCMHISLTADPVLLRQFELICRIMIMIVPQSLDLEACGQTQLKFDYFLLNPNDLKKLHCKGMQNLINILDISFWIYRQKHFCILPPPFNLLWNQLVSSLLKFDKNERNIGGRIWKSFHIEIINVPKVSPCLIISAKNSTKF